MTNKQLETTITEELLDILINSELLIEYLLCGRHWGHSSVKIWTSSHSLKLFLQFTHS